MELRESGTVRAGQGFFLRVLLALIGGGAGATWWFVGDHLGALVTNPQLFLFIAVYAIGFFVSFFSLVGPLPLLFAFPMALLLGLLPSGLLTWASLRHDSLSDFFARIDPVVAGCAVGFLPLPFVAAALTKGVSWRNYIVLFNVSWGIVIRFVAAALFVLVFWLAIFLSDELLRLAGIEVIRTLIGIDWVPAVATGMVAGLALAVVNEMHDLVSYSLVLRMLRLAIPPALLVVGAFAIALPFQGYDVLFGILSPSGTLLMISLVLILLINAAIGPGEASAIQTLFMRLSTRALSLLLPVLAALAVEGVRVRIMEHGISPGRLALGLAASVVLLYAILYAIFSLTGRKWMARIRKANVWMALLVFVLAVSWLSPILNSERFSANSQLSRFRSGDLSAEHVDLWALSHEWGRPGRSALDQLKSLENPDIMRRLALLDVAPDRATFERPATVSVGGGNSRADLKAIMPIQPPEARAEFDRYVLPWYAGSVSGFLEGCNDQTASGNPGCVLVVVDLLPENPGNEGILFYKSFGILRGEVIVPEPIFRRADASEIFSAPPPDFEETDQIIDALQAGEFTTGPASINAISIGERQFTVPF